MGEDFRAELARVVTLVAEGPEAGSPLAAGRRRWLMKRFPYAVVYRVVPDGAVRVLAVAHHRRRAGYWHARA